MRACERASVCATARVLGACAHARALAGHARDTHAQVLQAELARARDALRESEQARAREQASAQQVNGQLQAELARLRAEHATTRAQFHQLQSAYYHSQGGGVGGASVAVGGGEAVLQEDRQEELNQALLVLMDGWWIDRMCVWRECCVGVGWGVGVGSGVVFCVRVGCMCVCVYGTEWVSWCGSECLCGESAYSLVCPSVFLQCVCLSVCLSVFMHMLLCVDQFPSIHPCIHASVPAYTHDFMSA